MDPFTVGEHGGYAVAAGGACYSPTCCHVGGEPVGFVFGELGEVQPAGDFVPGFADAAVVDGLGFVRTAFDEAVKFIGQVWETIRGIVAKPAAFVIDAVYNRGIREAWNKVAGWLNLPELAEYKPDWLAAYMATGGQVAGPAGRDRVPAMLTDGEWVHKTAAVDYYGPR